jgi:hypothetical protein
MLEGKPVNQETDCIIADYSFVSKIHNEIMEKIHSYTDYGDKFIKAAKEVAASYGAEAYSAGETDYYMFRFKTEKDKFAFILKNI